ncbi:MAG: methionyl-tRNA formyltransferase [Alphaproteobacteria bacterium]|nr:methionyl-tRNA formyltransferase [Alphaproteobacteria bacterium]
MRIAFMGSPAFGLPTLDALVADGHEIACVYTQAPKPSGRGRKERKTPIHEYADARGFAVRTPRSLKKAEAQEAFAALKLDCAVVVAYGLILPRTVLAAPRLGCVNLHASLLPRWRGAAPIQRAIMAGDRVTGVQAMRMEEGLDTGPIYASAETPIEGDDTFASVHDRLAALGAPLMAETLRRLARGEASATPQAEDGVVYAHKLAPEDARIDWRAPARSVDCQIRGLSPAPGAWFQMPDGARAKALFSRVGLGEGAPGETLDDALLIACGVGAVRLLRLQREGRAAMAAEDFLRGAPIAAGARFS